MDGLHSLVGKLDRILSGLIKSIELPSGRFWVSVPGKTVACDYVLLSHSILGYFRL